MPRHSSTRFTFPLVELKATSAKSFVEYWSKGYSYTAEDLYTSNIGRPLVPSALQALFKWKNGGKLSGRKYKSVKQNYIDRCDDLQRLPKTTTAEEFLRQFGGGPIWRIFLLHCWNPARFPIYDQHVHRAMEYIQTRDVREIPSRLESVLRSYNDRYVPFWQTLSELPSRSVDKALWSFGKFLTQLPSGALDFRAERITKQ